jgi:hypothetical protein
MLLEPNEDNKSGSCVFMLTPASVEGINSNLGIVVSELKVDGEQEFICSESDSGIELTVIPRELPVVRFVLNVDFHGMIYTEFNGAQKCIGKAKPAKKENA